MDLSWPRGPDQPISGGNYASAEGNRDHTFDFVVPASRRAPERLIRAVNRPSRDLAEAMAFSWVDTKEARPVASKFYAFLNDENRPPTTSIVDALRNYDIVPVIWSHRDEVRQELAA